MCEAPLVLNSLSFTCLITGRHPGSEGRRVRREKTDADCAASQHLFQTDNFTGNWTKANSWGFCACVCVCLVRARGLLLAAKEHQTDAFDGNQKEKFLL